MQLVNITMISKRNLLGLVFFALPFVSLAQENSPYSRYGVGNPTPQGNIVSRGMGGISAAYSDFATVNFLNPASYGDLRRFTLDIALEIDSRTLISQNPVDKFTSHYATVPYLQVGIPLYNPQLHPTKRAAKKGFSWAANFGLRPITKINYKIESDSRIPNIDSVATTYEGSGGVNEAFIGTGIKLRHFSIGFNVGYLFGNKDYSTRLEFINDSVNYIKSNSETITSFGGVSFNAGIQYVDSFKNHNVLKLGAYGNLSQNYKASEDLKRESFVYNSIGGTTALDSIYKVSGVAGTLKMPASFGIGFIMEQPHIVYGIDYEATYWNSYRFYGQPDYVQNSWNIKGGFQYAPATRTSRKYFDFMRYRLGAYYGNDYVNIDNKMPLYGVTAGFGIPLKLNRSFYETQYSVMNLALEYGSRGNKNNNIRENIFRLSLGFSLSDIWFRRYKYD